MRPQAGPAGRPRYSRTGVLACDPEGAAVSSVTRLREGLAVSEQGTIPRPGRGLVEFSRVAGRTTVTRARSASPLKLLCPRVRGPSAWVFASTYGGGLV